MFHKEITDYTIECRRKIHRYAELSGKELKTNIFICEEMKKLNLELYNVGKNSIIAILRTGKKGPNILLRADMDALPIEETDNNLMQKRVCQSENPGCFHACGHDAHVAMLLAAMKILAQKKEQLTGNIYACFESGEETGVDIKEIVKALEEFQIDVCWGIHVNSELKAGQININEGPRMAGVVLLDITIVGKGGHGSRPDLSFNPVFCAAAILNNLSAIWTNQMDPNEMVSLGITQIVGGNSCNIFPETAKMSGTIRFFNKTAGEKAVQIMKKVMHHTAEMNGCNIIYNADLEDMWMPVANDAKLSELIRKKLSEEMPPNTVVSCSPICGSETFSHISQKYPGVYAFLGVKNENYGSGAPVHNQYFDIDESALDIGVKATIEYVYEVQKEFHKNSGRI